jgi:hypothetical protein
MPLDELPEDVRKHYRSLEEFARAHSLFHEHKDDAKRCCFVSAVTRAPCEERRVHGPFCHLHRQEVLLLQQIHGEPRSKVLSGPLYVEVPVAERPRPYNPDRCAVLVDDTGQCSKSALLHGICIDHLKRTVKNNPNLDNFIVTTSNSQ